VEDVEQRAGIGAVTLSTTTTTTITENMSHLSDRAFTMCLVRPRDYQTQGNLHKCLQCRRCRRASGDVPPQCPDILK
jgi:hypothetical protein